MSLGAVLNSARSSLAAISTRTQTVSENISNVDNPGYSRRRAQNVAGRHGVLRVSITRAQDREILQQMLEYTSLHASSQALSDGVDKLGLIYGGADSETSPAALLGRLQGDIQAFISMPASAAAASRAIGSARDLSAAINRGADAIRSIRLGADEEISRSVAHINALLHEFHQANAAIVTGRLSDAERARSEEARDNVLAKLAGELDIKTVQQSDGGLAIYTTEGAVLYERGAREVRFSPSPNLQSGAPGGQVYIDNIQVTGLGAIMKLSSGKLTGLIRLRDDVAAGWEVQLDELARGLIGAFAERDSGGGPDAPGLFTWPGAPGLPPSATHMPGLAHDLRLNPLADPVQGGDPFLLRDGGMAGASYVANTTGVAGFTQRLLDVNAALDAPQGFDPAAQLGGGATVKDFAARSLGWLDAHRAEARKEKDYNATLLTRASDALSRATGVNLDDELAVMMRLERSYQATARVMSTVDTMLATLMDSMR